jgi:hypothetical protein
MNKTQFWILNIVGGICALLIVANQILVHKNESSGQTLMGRQGDLNQARQVENTMINLAKRIAAAGQTEPAMSNLLVRHDLKLQDNPPKTSP